MNDRHFSGQSRRRWWLPERVHEWVGRGVGVFPGGTERTDDDDSRSHLLLAPGESQDDLRQDLLQGTAERTVAHPRTLLSRQKHARTGW